MGSCQAAEYPLVTTRKVKNLAAFVGSNISQLRRSKGMTQAELAERLGVGNDSFSRAFNT
ncbi:helix-turn-helix domain-containing protein [uncultured Desulfovibrio sp.]|uniref:helix-turn-helix domain-containing protein n=1 Tax=Desulfovibrio legallii TaxID=571438 RepID=UPI00349F608A